MKTTRLRITLREVTPTVVRVIDVPAASTLPELHELLQAAMGWTDSHLHQFIAGDVRYGAPREDNWDGQLDESDARLKDLPTAFAYWYDFGDDWEHDVEVLGTGGDTPGCIEGEGMCPPEDCGGVGGHAELLQVLADPNHEDYEQMRTWAGDLRDFDQPTTDLLLKQTVGEVPASGRLVLDLIGDGVKLTPGGRLPRVLVRQVQEQRPHWYPLRRPASVEEDLLPLAALHEILRHVGLLRLSNGLLTPTRAAGNNLDVIRRLRRWVEPDSFEDITAGVPVALLVTRGPQTSTQLAALVFPQLGHGWVAG